jgi:hypothetical protein
VEDQSRITFPLQCGLALESCGRGPDAAWRLVDPSMLDEEREALVWEVPSGRLQVSGQGMPLEVPEQNANLRYLMLVGDKTDDPVAVVSREPNGDRGIPVVEFGGFWVAEWIGELSEVVITRVDDTVIVPWHSRARYSPSSDSGPGWYRSAEVSRRDRSETDR